MMRRKDPIRKLGADVREVIDTQESPTARTARRDNIVPHLEDAVTNTSRGRPPWTLVVAVAASLLLVSAGLAAYLLTRSGSAPIRPDGAITAVVVDAAGTSRRVHEGAWLEAGSGSPVKLGFAEGSRMELVRGSRAHLLRLAKDEVVLGLNHGRLVAHIVPGGATRWIVRAGPYRTTVLGTAFEVRWDAPRGRLVVQVRRGRVRVQGGLVSGGGLVLRARQRLAVDGSELKTTTLTDASTDGRPSTAASPALAVDPPTAKAHGGVPGTSTPSETVTGPRKRVLPATPKWKRLLAAGRTAEAVAEAARVGFTALTRTLPAADLWLLATACRHARKGRCALTALKAIIRRFPTTHRANIAVFLVGRVLANLQGDHRAAAAWLDRYLKQTPKGALAEEALGRYMGACRRAGRKQEARAAARRYLRLYPTGTFRVVAKKLLSK